MNRFVGIFLFVIAIVVFAWLSAGISLLDDDWGHIKLAANGVGFIFSTGWEGLVGQGGYYRPIVVLSLYLNYLIGGFSPAGYHFLNVLIHAGCAGLVFVLGRQLGLLRWVCWGGSGLFFVLPIHTDSVFWIVGRTDTVCALFYLGSMIVFLMLLGEWSIGKLGALIFCAGLAFLSKEMALSLPGVLLVLAWYRNRLTAKSGVLGVGAVVIVLLMYFVVRWVVLGGIFGGTPTIRFSVVRWGVDLAKSFAKFGMTDLKWFGGVVLVITGGLFVWGWRKDRYGLWSLPLMLTMICVVSLVPVLGHLHNWYLYIPSAFFCLVIADFWLRNSGRIFSFLFVGLLLYYTGVMAREASLWRGASRLSEGFVADVLPSAQTTKGRLFVLNTPSAWTPQNSVSGKPLFAFALKNALSMRSAKPLPADIVMVNHVWLTGELVCAVTRKDNLFQSEITGGGYFSFHGGNESLQPPFRLDQHWGHVNTLSQQRLSVVIDLKPDDQVIFFDGTQVKAF